MDMSDNDKPKGPDLSLGTPAADIAEGQMLSGHVGDEPVLIARLDGALRAISASCTHYQGPLAEGLIVDGAVRCPWHHACFSLTTGEAVGAPAFAPVACWTIVERGGDVFITGKAAPPSPASAAVSPSTADRRVVIIGGGAGGFAAAELLRRRGFEGPLTILSADRDAPYDRPNASKDYLAGKAPADWKPLQALSFYQDQAIDLRLETAVERFDPPSKTVTLSSGASLSYDILILATGAEPQRPKLPGLDGAKVFVLRTLSDADALIEAAKGAKRVAVIGASFIGLEAAAALRQRDLEVHVIAPEPVPFEALLGHEIGVWAKTLHEKNGVTLHLGRKVLGYQDGAVNLDKGDPIPADLVLLGTGVKPRTALAEAAGLLVDDGVLVNDRLQTSAPGVYAIGDIARYPDPSSGNLIRVEHWVHAERQGQHVARLILGEDAPFTDPPFFWSAHYESAIHYSGHAVGFDEVTVDGSVADYDATVRYESDGTLRAVATLNRDVATLQAEAAFEAGAKDGVS